MAKKQEEALRIPTPTASGIQNQTKSQLQGIVSNSQEISEITQLFHSSMQEYVDLWKLHTGIQDPRKKDEYSTVMSSPEVLNGILSEKKKSEINFYEAAISIGHVDLMAMFAGVLKHKITKQEAFVGLKNAINVGRGNEFFESQDIAVKVLYNLSGLKNSYSESLFSKNFTPDQIVYISAQMNFGISKKEAVDKGNLPLQEKVLQVLEKNIISSKNSKEAYKKNERFSQKMWDVSLNYRTPVAETLEEKSVYHEKLGSTEV